MLGWLIDFYSLIVCGAAFLLWSASPSTSPAARAVRRATEPVFVVLRRLVPAPSDWDLAPLVLYLALRLLRLAL